MWYNIRLISRKGVVTLKTYGVDAAEAVELIVFLFPIRQGFRVLDCVEV